MKTILFFAVCTGAYLLGSVSGAICISGRRPEGDIRSRGSGNAGATNMARVYGIKAGLAVLGIDMLKAVIAMTAGRLLLGEPGLCAAGICCILGHCCPVLYGFRGGKGVSVGAAAALMIDWRVFAAAILCFAAAAAAGKKVSLASMLAAAAAAAASVLLGKSAERITLAVVCALIIVVMHRKNIIRLLNGTEPDFKAGKGKIRVEKRNK